MKFISVKCPECGAVLDIDEGRKQCFCSYCGSKIFLQNENEYIFRHIDDAEVKRAETDQMVRSMQIEAARQKRAEIKKAKQMKQKIALIGGVIGGVVIVFGYLIGDTEISSIGVIIEVFAVLLFIISTFNDDDDDTDLILEDKAKVPEVVYDAEKKTYTVIEESFRASGFRNVKSIPLNDLTIGVLKKPGFVESVTVGGKTAFSGDKYPKDSPVIISYHSMK